MATDQRKMYWIACSGGLDSVVLAHVMTSINKKTGLLHCNFQLRGEDAEKDEKFVVQLGQQLGVPVKVKRWKTEEIAAASKENIQLTARKLRYAWFNTFIERGDRVCLGHHRDDQVETFFLQMRRGGKVRGLSCMPQYRAGFVRPLLSYKKSELLALARKHQWSWREDATNASNDYRRNFYRNLMLPLLKKGGLSERDVLACVENFQYVLSDLQKRGIAENKNGVVKIDHSAWECWPYWYKHYILSVHHLSKFPVREIDKLLESGKGAHFQSEKRTVWNEGSYLAIAASVRDTRPLKTTLIISDELNYGDEALYIDADQVQGQLATRKWQNGDTFQPLGVAGKKKVGKFLRDKQVPHHLRPQIQVLLDNQKVIGLFGYLPDSGYRVKKSTKLVRRCNLQ